MDKQDFLPFEIIHGNYKYSDDDLTLDRDKIFLNSFYLENRLPQIYDHAIDYRYNSHNYRSPDFAAGIDAIVAGCSNTYGIGIPEKARWSNILSEMMSFKFVNLGIPGASVSLIVSEVMHYIQVYGKPEYVFCMFPDFARITVFVKQGLNSPFEDWGLYGLTQTHMMGYSDISQRPKYIKKPFAYEDVLSVETSYYYSLKAIQMLEQFCNAMSIKLYWGAFWDLDREMIASLLDNSHGYYKNFVDDRSGRWHRRHDGNGKDQYVSIPTTYDAEEIDVNCHEDRRKDFPAVFDLALDLSHGIEGAHYGFHRNLHVAEKFYSLVKD